MITRPGHRHDEPRTRTRRTGAQARGPDTGVQPDLGGHRGSHGSGERALPDCEPGRRCHVAPGRHIRGGIGVRLRDACLLCRSGVLRPRVPHRLGGKGALAHSTDGRALLAGPRGCSHPGGFSGSPRHGLCPRQHPGAEAAVWRGCCRDRQDDGAVVAGLPLFRRRALPADDRGRARTREGVPRPSEGGHCGVRPRPDQCRG